ncbi:serine/threonine protein kinase [Nitzschia inconspicua]|uniref:Serine/threonine protein kinase n=1 Tax=Nitzschia inconspicua TaxID=303405 RepID=A0A9K3Q4R4_9STRA|nr:serine/threonine protein kinase [Nitzschia inconspicua]
MDSTLRNHAMVTLQNQQRQRSTGVSNGSMGGTMSSTGNHNYNNQWQQYPPQSSQPRHYRQQQQQQHHGSFAQHSHHDQQMIYQQQQQQQHYRRYGSTSGQNSHGLSSSLQQYQQQQQQQQYHPSDHFSVGSHYSRESGVSSQNSSTVDEAYRRLGQRLSMRAHGGDMGSYNRSRRIAKIAVTPRSGFSSFADATKERESKISKTVATERTSGAALSPASSAGSSLNRTSKVAKKRLSDHGDHHSHHSKSIGSDSDGLVGRIETEDIHVGNIVRKMTVNVNELFRIWQRDHSNEKLNHKRAPPSSTEAQIAAGDLSPHRKAFSELALEGGKELAFHDHHMQNSSTKHPSGQSSSSSAVSDGSGINFGNGHSNMLNSNNGLLSAVIESASQTSSKTTPVHETANTGDDNGSVRSKESRASSSIATRSSLGTRSSMRSFVGGMPPRGKCLTQPSEGVSNEGLDNNEGNLIVFENDSISVTRKQIHALTKGRMKNIQHADFRVQSLLGQGTFAQVFQCLHVQTGQMVAVKVVKNKPAYTRQAAVEIDVFRALTKPSEGSNGDESAEQDNRLEYMVDMLCYFMYKGHLCLVFELLGLNLYEVLKKRQFRGLPLTVVRKLVQQAVLGTKELARKSIVHCDLKPENVLLITEDDVESVVTAGESKRLSSSLRSTCSLDKNASRKTPPTSSATVNTTGENSGNSTSTSNTDNTKTKKMGHPTTGEQKEEDSSIATASPVNKTLPTSFPGKGNSIVDSKEEKMTYNKRILASSPTHSDGTNTTHGFSLTEQRIKLIDFGSACFEGQTAHTYIQSRFYRSPEVLIGLTYDSAIDMWSLGCVAAELFLGLPILPGVHEHDQLCRISEMIAELPDWMLDQGSKTQKYFVKFVPAPTPHSDRSTPPGRQLPQWRIKTQSEFIASLSQSEIKRKGGMAKLEKQPANRYFKRRSLADIIFHKGQSGGLHEEKDQLLLFIHFLHGILDPDPWKRWTAFQAASHPFLTGKSSEGRYVESATPMGKDENHANKVCGYYWKAPSDPTIYRRKLLNVQKIREKQQVARQRHNRHGPSRANSPGSQSGLSEEVVASSVHGETDQKGSLSRSGSHQMASSYTEFTNAPNLAGDAAPTIYLQRLTMTGPQSYSEAGPSGPLPGSFNDLDFAYALQRPGVVPMGDASVCSTVDPIFNGHTTPHGHHQQHPSYLTAGSYGSHRVSQKNVNGRLSATTVPIATRSFDEGGSTLPSTIISSPPHSNRSVATSDIESATADTLNVAAPNLASPATVAAPTPPVIPGLIQPQQAMDGNMAAQVYLQQQHAALQQQQFLLQQQQAALALQQQQLQAYGFNPLLLNTNAPNPLGGMNSQQFNIIGSTAGGYAPTQPVGGGYYYVSAADGTPMLMAANPAFQGQMIQPSQFQGQIATTVGQSQGLTNPATAGIMGQQPLPNVTGIPGMIAFSPAGIPAGMMPMASNTNNNNGYSNRAPGSSYPSNVNGNSGHIYPHQ